jgi:predicted DNA-binding transcriptional regulator AlpA
MEPLLNPKQVKQLLSCSLPWVYKAAGNGTLPCVRIPCPGSGKREKHLIRFKKTDIFEFIEKHYGK